MRYGPKLGFTFSDEELSEFAEDSHGVIELQIEGPLAIDECLPRMADVVKRLIAQIPGLERVVIHLPMHSIDLLEFQLRKGGSDTARELFRTISRISREQSIELCIVTHFMRDERFYNHYGLIDAFQDFVKSLAGSKAYILVENNSPSLPSLGPQDCMYEVGYHIVSEIEHPNLGLVLDVCHTRIFMNYLLLPCLLATGLANRVMHIHFSNADDHDGVVDPKTHSAPHNDLDSVKEDMKLLHQLIDVNKQDLTLVAEINEVNFEDRVNLQTEMDLLNYYFNKPV